MKQRYLMCLLLCGAMLYYQLPKLSLSPGHPGLPELYSSMWLVLAFFAAAGNLAGLLYSPGKRAGKRKQGPGRKRMHDYQ
ncbi:hypothetical protein V1498_05080 [Peribacillus sp. SCS-26]|uniref:hypothetical protein n=1 Tax=Paraperibacillus marinus TaxID=3115295 RepID=UPI003906129A